VERYLSEKEVDESIVGDVVVRLQEQGFLDDESFARFWIENREQFRPRGRRALAYELRQKGLSNAAIDSALAALDESELAWAAIRDKVLQWENLDQVAFTNKALGYLSRRGFPYAICREAVDRAWLELHDTD